MVGLPRTFWRSAWKSLNHGPWFSFPNFLLQTLQRWPLCRLQVSLDQKLLLKHVPSQMPGSWQGPDLQNIFLWSPHYSLGPGPCFDIDKILFIKFLALFSQSSKTNAIVLKEQEKLKSQMLLNQVAPLYTMYSLYLLSCSCSNDSKKNKCSRTLHFYVAHTALQ